MWTSELFVAKNTEIFEINGALLKFLSPFGLVASIP